MKKLTFLGLLLFCSAFVYAQESMILDDAIKDSVNFFSSRLKSGSTVAVTNFEAETKELSDFIIQELSVSFANTGSVRVVERSRLEMLESELNFNMSGLVSDETAQGIGRMIGAQILFSGSIIPYRDMYRMRVQAIVVETAEVIGTRTINVKYDPTLTGLLGRINPAYAWKYQRLYAGIWPGYGQSIFGDNSDDFRFISYGAFFAVQFTDLIAVGVDVMGAYFIGDYWRGRNDIFVGPTARLTLRPSNFEIDVFLGPAFGTSFAFFGGVQAGYHLGPGVAFFDLRLNSYLGFSVGVGYQIGFIPRKK